MTPPSLYNWSSAIEFFVSGNILSGNFTPNMGFNFPQLRKFCIAGNQFTGIIPDTLSNISGLELLDLGNNYLTGQVPDSLGVLKDLYWLSLEFDKLGRGTSGDLNLLYSLPNVSSLRIINLQANNFGPCYPSLVSQKQHSPIVSHLYNHDDINRPH